MLTNKRGVSTSSPLPIQYWMNIFFLAISIFINQPECKAMQALHKQKKETKSVILFTNAF